MILHNLEYRAYALPKTAADMLVSMGVATFKRQIGHHISALIAEHSL